MINRHFYNNKATLLFSMQGKFVGVPDAKSVSFVEDCSVYRK